MATPSPFPPSPFSSKPHFAKRPPIDLNRDDTDLKRPKKKSATGWRIGLMIAGVVAVLGVGSLAQNAIQTKVYQGAHKFELKGPTKPIVAGRTTAVVWDLSADAAKQHQVEKVELCQEGVLGRCVVLASTAINDGEQLVNIPASFPAGKAYIKLTARNNEGGFLTNLSATKDVTILPAPTPEPANEGSNDGGGGGSHVDGNNNSGTHSSVTNSESTSVSPTPTLTPSPSDSATPSASPDVSPSPSDSPLPSESVTPSPSPSDSPLPSDSVTPSPSPSDLPSPTPSPSDTPSPSATPSPSETPTPSSSPTPSATPLPLPHIPDTATTAEEFVGPFPSWKNIKTEYGAKGDGSTDDTNAIQAALDELRTHQQSNVLYFPAGTYRITKTLVTTRTAHTDFQGISIIGEDPTTTSIKWDGPDHAPLLSLDAWYSKISRLTLDGSSKAGSLIGWGPSFSTYNETSDMVFENADIGLDLATGDGGQAENSILRSTFKHLATAGIRTNNFNSLDEWVWYSRFEDNGWAMYNGAGNFHAFGNIFMRSSKGDIGSANLATFSFINNTSVDSNNFIDWHTGGHSWGSPTSISGNTVINPTGDASTCAIGAGNAGPYLMNDNTVVGGAGSAYCTNWGVSVVVGNQWTNGRAIAHATQNDEYLSIDNQQVSQSALSTTLPTLPPTPPHVTRTIFEVPPGAHTAAIQALVDQAAARNGTRPVIHFAKGVYTIDAPVVVPAGTDMQFIGDGGAETTSVLNWTGSASDAAFILQGPSHASVRDLYIKGPAGTAIRVTNADQDGGKVFLSQVSASGGLAGGTSAASVLLNGLDRTDVFLQDTQGGSATTNWLHAIGGDLRSTGQAAPGQITAVAGGTGSADHFYDVEKGAAMVVRGIYHEIERAAPQPIVLTDSGALSVDATRFSIASSATLPTFSVNNFKGQLTMVANQFFPVNSTTTESFGISGDGSATKVLAMANLVWLQEAIGLPPNPDAVWHDTSSPPAKATFLFNNVNSSVANATRYGGYDAFDIRGTANPDFVKEMLEPLRSARFWVPTQVPGTATGVGFYRVVIATGQDGTALDIRAGQ